MTGHCRSAVSAMSRWWPCGPFGRSVSSPTWAWVVVAVSIAVAAAKKSPEKGGRAAKVEEAFESIDVPRLGDLGVDAIVAVIFFIVNPLL